jgi:hypothetical protein
MDRDQMIRSRFASSTNAGMGPASSPAPRARLAVDAERVDRVADRATPAPYAAAGTTSSPSGVDDDAPSRLLARLGVRRVDASDGRGLALRPVRPACGRTCPDSGLATTTVPGDANGGGVGLSERKSGWMCASSPEAPGAKGAVAAESAKGSEMEEVEISEGVDGREGLERRRGGAEKETGMMVEAMDCAVGGRMVVSDAGVPALSSPKLKSSPSLAAVAALSVYMSSALAGLTGLLPGMGSSRVAATRGFTRPGGRAWGIGGSSTGPGAATGDADASMSWIWVSGEDPPPEDDGGRCRSQGKSSELAMDLVSERLCESRDMELRAVVVLVVLVVVVMVLTVVWRSSSRERELVGRTTWCSDDERVSRHEFRFGDGGSSSGLEASGRAKGGATMRRGVGGVGGRGGCCRFLARPMPDCLVRAESSIGFLMKASMV